MRPDDHRLKLQSAAVSRGRMYLKSCLGFLPGFPTGYEAPNVLWIPTAGEGVKTVPLHLSAETLRQAAFGWTKLSGRFPKALPKIVEDIEAWRTNLPKLLNILACAVREGNPLPECLFNTDFGYSRSATDLAKSILHTQPELAGLLNALSWEFCLNPVRSAKSLSWLEANGKHVKGILANLPGWKGILTTIQLCNLASEDGEGRVAPLLSVLGCPEGETIATRGGQDYIDKWLTLESHRLHQNRQKKVVWPEKPRATWFSSTLKFFEMLRNQSVKVRRTALGLFGLIFPEDLLFRWRHWWDQVEEETAQLRRLILASRSRRIQPSSLLDEEVAAVVAQLKRLVANSPPEIQKRHLFSKRGEWLSRIEQLAESEFKSVRHSLLNILERVDKEDRHGLPRATIFNNLAQWLRYLPKAQFGRVLRALQFSDIPRNRLWHVIDDLDFSDIFRSGSSHVYEIDVGPERACRALAYWLGDLKQTEHLDWPIAICRASDDPEKIRTCLAVLAGKEFAAAEVYTAAIETAVRITTGNAEFAEMVRALQEASCKDHSFSKKVTPLFEQFQQAGWRHIVSESVRAKEFSTLKTLALWADFARRLGKEVLPPAYPDQFESPEWTLGYPTMLRPSLTLLAAIAPDSRKLAANLLNGDFPDVDAVKREIEALRHHLDGDPSNTRLAKRLDNLRQRLVEPMKATAPRLKNLDLKIRRAIRRRLFDKWLTDLRAGLEEKIRLLLGVAEFPSWLNEERHQLAFAAILELSGWARALGLRLLRLRCGPPPWNLADDSANQQFIVHLGTLGIDPVAWLNPPGPVRVVGKNGCNVRLFFESDPLEIFQMGTPFDTCLSPKQINFFSTVANAADINKHVIFARDDRGDVIGRCLVAIAQNGGLLAFHPYCHNPELGFSEMVAAVLKDLAARMKTAVVNPGTVKSLVAGSWYDDGSVDLVGQYPCLKEGSTLRESLATVHLSDLVSLLETALEPVARNSVTLPLLLDLPEFESRPELVLPLLPRFVQHGTLALATIARAAWLAHRAGATAEAKRLVRLRIMPEVHRISAFDLDTLGTLVKIDPACGLRAIQSTRPRRDWDSGERRRVRSDDQEPATRRALLAEAYRSIGRINKAKRLMGTRCVTRDI